MVYLNSFTFPSRDREFHFFLDIKRTCYDSFYPFRILSEHSFERVDFEPITIFYGGNGSGKTTALNVIAEKIQAKRDSAYNKSNFFADYVNMCSMESDISMPKANIITSDDVFDYLLNIRYINEGVDQRREEIFNEYLSLKYSEFQFKSIDDYEYLKRVNSSRSKTQSRFVRSELMNNIRGYSNGESAFKFFIEKIRENGLYLLDEPENSLSPKLQLKLKEFLEDLARFSGCQFIISTHSPFLLSMKGAKIYDLDENPVDIKPWTELENIRILYGLLKEFEDVIKL
ncbi:MAG TPA: AAA family ATPase, partial [Clostridiales bacterium]|nr:AAA family ATPase [Clostridiales bacterium]